MVVKFEWNQFQPLKVASCWQPQRRMKPPPDLQPSKKKKKKKKKKSNQKQKERNELIAARKAGSF